MKKVLFPVLFAFLSLFLIACGNGAKKALDKLTLPTEIKADYPLPKTTGKYNITYTIPENEYVKLDGNVLKITKEPTENYKLTVTASIDKYSRNFEITILKAENPVDPNIEIIQEAYNNLSLANKVKNTDKLTLPTVDGVEITYEEKDTKLLKIENNEASLVDPNITEDKTIKISATLTKGEAKLVKEFTVIFTKDSTEPTPEEENDKKLVKEAINNFSIKSPLNNDEELPLVNKMGEVSLAYTEVNTAYLEITNTSAKLKDNNITSNLNVQISVTFEKGKYSETKIYSIVFNKKATATIPEGFISVKEALTKNDNDLVNVAGIIVEKTAGFRIYIMDLDKGAVTEVNHEKGHNGHNSPFTNFNKGDIITIPKVHKTSTNNLASLKNVEEKDSVKKIGTDATFVEPVSDLTDYDNQYSANGVYKLFNINSLTIKEIKEGKKDKNNKASKTLRLTDDNNKEYIIYADKNVPQEALNNLQVGQKINLKNIRLSHYKGSMQFLYTNADQIEKVVVELTDKDKIEYEINQFNLEPEWTNNQDLALIRTGQLYNTVQINWTSSHNDIVNPQVSDIVHASYLADVDVTLTAEFSLGSEKLIKTYTIKVKKRAKTVNESLNELTLSFTNGEDKDHVKSKVTLLNKIDSYDVVYEITPANAGVINSDNTEFIPNEALINDTPTKLIAKITHDGETYTKEFDITVLKSSKSPQELIDIAKAQLSVVESIKAHKKIELPTEINGINITWSEKENQNKFNFTTGLLNDQGITNEENITFLATFTLEGITDSKEFIVKFIPSQKFSATFDLNGGTVTNAIPVQNVIEDSPFTIPSETPTYSTNEMGHFKFWALDKNNPKAYDFTTPAAANITLYAIYQKCSTISEALAAPDKTQILTKGVVIGINSSDQGKGRGYLLADDTGIIKINLTSHEELPKLHQKVMIFGIKNTVIIAWKHLDYIELTDKGLDNFYQTFKEENQVIPSAGHITPLTKNFAFNNHHLKLVKFEYNHTQILNLNNDHYHIYDTTGNDILMHLLYEQNQFLSQEDLDAIKAIFSDPTKLGKYEITALVSEYSNATRLYIFNKEHIQFKEAISDDDLINDAKAKLEIPTEVKNDAEIALPKKIGNVDITYSETTDPNLLQLANDIAKLINQDITEDKEVTIKAVFKINSTEKEFIYTIKFLKKGATVGTSTIIDFSKNTQNKNGISASELKEFLNQMAESEVVTEVKTSSNVSKGNGPGGYKPNDSKFLKLGTSKKKGSMTFTTNKKVKKIKITGAAFTKKNGNGNLIVNSTSKNYDNGEEVKEYVYEFSAATNEITVEASNRFVISKIELIYE